MRLAISPAPPAEKPTIIVGFSLGYADVEANEILGAAAAKNAAADKKVLLFMMFPFFGVG